MPHNSTTWLQLIETPNGDILQDMELEWEVDFTASADWEIYGSDADGRRGEKRWYIEDIEISEARVNGNPVVLDSIPPGVRGELMAIANEWDLNDWQPEGGQNDD